MDFSLNLPGFGLSFGSGPEMSMGIGPQMSMEPFGAMDPFGGLEGLFESLFSQAGGGLSSRSIGGFGTPDFGGFGTPDFGGSGGLGGLPGGTLTQKGSVLQNNDVNTALTNFDKNDPQGFESFMNDLNKGDGNSAAWDLDKAVKDGKLTKADASALASQIQSTAYANGGGTLNKHAKQNLNEATGSSTY